MKPWLFFSSNLPCKQLRFGAVYLKCLVIIPFARWGVLFGGSWWFGNAWWHEGFVFPHFLSSRVFFPFSSSCSQVSVLAICKCGQIFTAKMALLFGWKSFASLPSCFSTCRWLPLRASGTCFPWWATSKIFGNKVDWESTADHWTQNTTTKFEIQLLNKSYSNCF